MLLKFVSQNINQWSQASMVLCFDNQCGNCKLVQVHGTSTHQASSNISFSVLRLMVTKMLRKFRLEFGHVHIFSRVSANF